MSSIFQWITHRRRSGSSCPQFVRNLHCWQEACWTLFREAVTENTWKGVKIERVCNDTNLSHYGADPSSMRKSGLSNVSQANRMAVIGAIYTSTISFVVHLFDRVLWLILAAPLSEIDESGRSRICPISKYLPPW